MIVMKHVVGKTGIVDVLTYIYRLKSPLEWSMMYQCRNETSICQIWIAEDRIRSTRNDKCKIEPSLHTGSTD